MNLFKIIWHHMVVTLTLLILLLVLVLKGRCQKSSQSKKKIISQQIYFLGPIKATFQWNIREKLEMQEEKQKPRSLEIILGVKDVEGIVIFL